MAPLRGVYTPGFSATNSGVLPEPGFTYSNTFHGLFIQSTQCTNCGELAHNSMRRLDRCQRIHVGQQEKDSWRQLWSWWHGFPSPIAHFPWRERRIRAHRRRWQASLIPTYQPATMGWHLKRADITAPTLSLLQLGDFNAGASNNTGSGHWTNAPTAGETFYLTKNKGTAFSAYEMYEFHTTQNGTNIHPGQTFDLDYSLTQIIPLQKDMHTLLQVGVVGYGQWQTSNNSGPGVDPQHPGHYRVNANWRSGKRHFAGTQGRSGIQVDEGILELVHRSGIFASDYRRDYVLTAKKLKADE